MHIIKYASPAIAVFCLLCVSAAHGGLDHKPLSPTVNNDLSELYNTQTTYGEQTIVDDDIDEEEKLSNEEMAKQYKNARMAFLFGQYKLAYKIWLPLAEDGYADAQATIGWMYHTDKGVKKNLDRAYYWYQKAAKQGHLIAQNNIGVFHEQGLGNARKSTVIAAIWYEKSAELGYPYAQYNLGMLYKDGRGVKKSKNDAIYWLQIAALQGVEQAQDALSQLGSNVPNHKKRKPIQKPLWNKQGKKYSRHNFSKLNKHVRPRKPVFKNDWVLKQNPKYYTLQIAGGNNLTSLLEITTAFPPRIEAAIYESRIKGKKFYGLLYGKYPNIDSAKKDADNLPDKLQKWTPWIRKFRAIQSKLRR